MTERRVGVVYSPREWRKPFQLHVRNHITGMRVVTVRDERVALDEDLDVLIVEDDTSYLTADFVDRLRRRGVRLVGIHDPTDDTARGEAYLRSVGIDTTIEAFRSSAEILNAVTSLDLNVDAGFAEIAAQLDGFDRPAEDGLVVAVGGPAAVGKTELAVALAAILSSDGAVLLVDASDGYADVAQRLHLSLHPHLLTAIEEARSAHLGEDGTTVLGDSLARPAPGSDRPPPPFDVVTGLANPDDWQVVRADDLAALLRRASTSWRWTICDTGPRIEDLGRLDRWVLSRTVVANADRIVGVCESTPRGLIRFLDWLANLSRLTPVPVDVAVNRADRNPHGRAEFEDQLRENAGAHVRTVTFVPDDRSVSRAAWDGHLPPRRFTKAARPIATELHGGLREAVLA